MFRANTHDQIDMELKPLEAVGFTQVTYPLAAHSL